MAMKHNPMDPSEVVVWDHKSEYHLDHKIYYNIKKGGFLYFECGRIVEVWNERFRESIWLSCPYLRVLIPYGEELSDAENDVLNEFGRDTAETGGIIRERPYGY